MLDISSAAGITNTESREELIDRLGGEIAELEAHITAAGHRQLLAIRDFDRLRGWADEGATSCASWLTWRIGLSGSVARERVRIANALAELPLTSAAHARGEVSYSQVRAMTRIATPENEAQWLRNANYSTASQLERFVRDARRAAACQEPDRHAVEQQARTLVTYIDDDGMLVVRGRLPAEAGAAFETALAAFEPGPSREGETREQRRADALVAMAERARSGAEGPSGGERHAVVVHVDATKLAAGSAAEGRCELDDGRPVSAEAAQRLACDAAVLRIDHGAGGEVLDVGRKTRTIPTGLGRALHARDGGCRFPGCSNRVVDAHHVVHWAQGGETKLENLCSLCRRHHTYVHEERFTVAPDGHGRFVFRRPDGVVVTPGSLLPEISARLEVHSDSLLALHETLDMAFHERAIRPCPADSPTVVLSPPAVRSSRSVHNHPCPVHRGGCDEVGLRPVRLPKCSAGRAVVEAPTGGGRGPRVVTRRGSPPHERGAPNRALLS